MYFEAQENQINAIQEASTNQLEKLQTQIDIMTETLEYQKDPIIILDDAFSQLDDTRLISATRLIKENEDFSQVFLFLVI